MTTPKAKKPPDPPDYTPDGAERMAGVQTDFRQLVYAQSVHQARRRGAKGIDNTDVDSAYRQLLNSRDRPFMIDVGAEVGLVVAGGLIGYGTTLLTSVPPLKGPGTILILSGLFIGGLCGTLKHVKF